MKAVVFTVAVGFALQVAVLGRLKNNRQFRQLSTQRTNDANFTFPQKDLIQKRKHHERPVIIFMNERKVTYNDQTKSRMKRNIEIFTEEGSGDLSTIPPQSTETIRTPEGSGDGFTTPEDSRDFTSSTIKTRPTETKPTLNCQNGGTSNGKICVCTPNFYGDRCEFVSGRIEIGPNVNVTVDVEIKIVNKNFIGNLENKLSEEYKELEKMFKNAMISVYSEVPGYKDMKILAFGNGSVIVNHSIILEVEYESHDDLIDNYKERLNNVETQLGKLTNYNCSGTQVCRSIVPENFTDYFSPHESQAICLSICEEESSNHHECNNGICRISPNAGASCSCVDTHHYIYTYANCGGKMPKSALYGGIGAAIGILIIALLIVGFFQLKQMRKNKGNAIKDNWYNDSIDLWQNESSIKYFRGDQQDGDSFSSKSAAEIFKPALDKVDPAIEVKMKRPTIAIA
ncbi:mucin-17-like isoform X2 [Ranitomeya variabilis]|uniref:mucin-17-like isoform X2 n=1 Tax=Ranitomeya variabilis TaxID=490064 RepID=UPI004056AA7B